MAALWLATLALSAPAHEITGVVETADERPVAGASVWLSQDRIVRTTQSDAEGAFRFEDVRTGPVEIVARTEGHAIGGLTGQVIGSTAIRLRLHKPASARLRVLDPNGQGVSGARVKRLVVDGNFDVRVEDLAAHGFPSIRSDEDGALVVFGLPEGSHMAIELTHRKYALLRIPYLPVGNEKPLAVQMFPGVPLRGRVVAPDGAGVAGARVLARPLGEALPPEDDLVTDAEGYFDTELIPGRYTVEATHPDFAAPPPVEGALDDPDAENEVILGMLAPCAIEGKVVGPDDAPMGGVFVGYLRDGYVQDRVVTARDGGFRLRVSAGDGRLRVYPPPGYVAGEQDELPVVIREVRHVDAGLLRLAALPRLRGTIVGPDGAPVARALVSTLDLEFPLRAVTGEDGRFEVQLRQPPEQPRLRVRAEHPRLFLRSDFEVTPDDPDGHTEPLERFEPDLRANDSTRVRNNMARLVGADAPELSCRQWLNGEPQSLSGLRGKVVVLTFWGGFDPYGRMRAQLDELNALRTVFEDADDVAFVGIHDPADDVEAVRQYIEDYGIGYPVGLDESRFTTFGRYRVNYLPQTVLIDKNGVLQYFDVEGRLLELIKDLRRRA